MYKTLPIVALILSTAACSMEQKPAPYVDKGGESFTKSARNDSSYDPNSYIDGDRNNSNFSRAPVESRSLMPQNSSYNAPVNRTDEVIDFSNNQQNSGYKAGAARPIIANNDYIDSDENSGNFSAVPLAPINNSYTSSNSSLGASYANNRAHPVMDEKAGIGATSNAPVPVGVANNTNKDYLDLGAVNNFNNPASGAATEPIAASKLGRAKPLAKPSYSSPEAEIAQTTAEAEAIEIPQAPTNAASVPAAPIRHSEVAPIAPQEVASVNSAISVPDLSQVKNGEDTIEKSPILQKDAPATDGPQFMRPLSGEIIGKFGNEADGTFSDGIKIRAPMGADVKAADGGEIVYSGNQLQGYGNMIIVRHSNGYLTSYAHLKNLDLKKGTKVSQGEVIGHVGDTGNVSEPQLHFGVREGREPVDPQKFLK